MLDFFGYEWCFRRLMFAAMNCHIRIPPCPCKRMDTVKGCLMQFQDQTRSQTKRTLWLLDKGPDHFQREIKLANAILSLAPRNFVRIVEEWRRHGNWT